MELNKLSGIYQIINKTNGRIYIGHSKNITFRWYHHINNLLNNNHPNIKLQEDFNIYGLSAFNFKILELTSNENLTKKEQEYLNNINFNNNYNIYNSNNKLIKSDENKFINYINGKWLVPKGISDNKLNKYKIYKDEHKQEIINMVIDCKLLKLYPSRITFNKVINLMENSLGYCIESQRGTINKKQHTYKLIIDFDEDKINLEEIINAS